MTTMDKEAKINLLRILRGLRGLGFGARERNLGYPLRATFPYPPTYTHHMPKDIPEGVMPRMETLKGAWNNLPAGIFPQGSPPPIKNKDLGSFWHPFTGGAGGLLGTYAGVGTGAGLAGTHLLAAPTLSSKMTQEPPASPGIGNTAATSGAGYSEDAAAKALAGAGLGGLSSLLFTTLRGKPDLQQAFLMAAIGGGGGALYSMAKQGRQDGYLQGYFAKEAFLPAIAAGARVAAPFIWNGVKYLAPTVALLGYSAYADNNMMKAQNEYNSATQQMISDQLSEVRNMAGSADRTSQGLKGALGGAVVGGVGSHLIGKAMGKPSLSRDIGAGALMALLGAYTQANKGGQAAGPGQVTVQAPSTPGTT